MSCLGAFSPAAALGLECGWLVGNDPRHRRPCRDVLRGGGPVACVMPVVTKFVTLLLADFVTGYPA
jgi:hypothetical protein